MEVEDEPSRGCILSICIWCLYAFVIVVLIITALSLLFGTTANNSDFYHSPEIGDTLGNSSLVIEVNSPASSTITFSWDQSLQLIPPSYAILLSDNLPSTITDYLPLEQLYLNPPLVSEQSNPEYRGDLNYLGSNEPIYLLSGSSITYNLTITSTQRINTTYLACLYLFSNGTHYNNFLTSVDSIIYNDSHCFASAVTPRATTTSHSFNIMHPGQYYVGIQLWVRSLVQADASVVRVYYNTTGLQETFCSDTTLCSIDVCNTFICSHKATTYFLIKPSDPMSIDYYFTSPRLHGSLFGGFIATIVLLWSFCCCCICYCFFCCYINEKQESHRFNRVHSNNESNYYGNSIDNDEVRLINAPEMNTEYNDFSQPECIDLHNVSADDQQSDTSSYLPETHTTGPAILQDACQIPSFKVEAAQTSLLLSCEYDLATSSQPQIDIDSPYWKHCFTTRTCDHLRNTANEKLLVKIKDAFGELHKLSLDRSGLVYHSSQYGVTLIIPEGAVQESATVWFGACLFSDKFKFGDYVPVTPIVWVHIDRKLDKCAELYIPHDVAISSETNLQQFTVLTAHDDDCSDVISFQENYESQFQVSPGLFKILSPHFCSNCVATQKRKYKSIPRRYLIARADKKNGSKELAVEFIFLCQQKGCKKVVEDQCAKEGFQILSYEPVTFTGDCQVSLSFEPPSVPGWKREEVGFCKDYISIEDIDYYQMMGCANAAEVTEDELERLEMLEDLLSYPPRFRIQFTSDAVVEKSEKVIVRFNQVHPPAVKNTILLEGSIGLPLSPTSSASSTGSTIDLMTYASDLLIGDCLRIIASEGDLREKWFDFGYKLGLTFGQLQNIGLTSIDSIQCTRNVIIHWRDQNKSKSWEPLAAALAKIGFEDLAHRVKHHFEPPSVPETEPEDYKGVYCKLCEKYHLNFVDIQHKIPNADSPPDMVDLINLVAVKIQDKFYEFGTALHLDDGFLRSLYVDYHDSLVRFIVILNRWKDNGPDAYTWSTVIKVLQSDAIGASKVAQNVMKHLTTNTEAAEYASS